MTSKYRLGVDIGGTFTDAVMVDMETGETRLSKVPTTPADPSVGFLTAVGRVVEGLGPEEVEQMVHATTVATNSIIQGKLAKSALVTTRGFRDVLEIQRQIRPKLYDLFFDKPAPLVPRYLRFEVTERLGPSGKVITPLDEEDVREVARSLKRESVESVAVSLLHSYRNPKHEQRVKEILREELGGTYLTLSSEICPVFREYPRASTTAINAGLMPIMSKYIQRLESELRKQGFSAGFYVMQSSGGIMTSDAARERPAMLVESGPAAGVIAAASIGRLLGHERVISFDMGGTTAKAGLIEKGEPKMAINYEVGVAATPGGGLVRGGGYPLKTPVIDLVEIGAGGGSIAWVDSGGSLRVGPQSAGAVPGPACYGAGGTEPTVTDANVVLGRVDPEYFLGGEMKLNMEAAGEAIEKRCARVLSGDVTKTAYAIVEIANANMLRALRLVSVERGYDPRDFVMVAFGGAGPMHVNRLAQELGIPKVIVPLNPGLASALGLLMTDVKNTYVTTLIQDLASLDVSKLDSMYAEMEAKALVLLKDEGIDIKDVTFNRSVDMRYVGQSYELEVPVSEGELRPEELRRMEEKFYLEHERTYGHFTRNEPVETVTVRLVGVGSIKKAGLRKLMMGGESAPVPISKRKVFFGEIDGFLDTLVYDRYSLSPGNVVMGPAIVPDPDATTIIHPGYKAEIDGYGNMVIS